MLDHRNKGFSAGLTLGKPMATTGAQQPSNQVSGDASKTKVKPGFAGIRPFFRRIRYRLMMAEEEYRFTFPCSIFDRKVGPPEGEECDSVNTAHPSQANSSWNVAFPLVLMFASAQRHPERNARREGGTSFLVIHRRTTAVANFPTSDVLAFIHLLPRTLLSK